MFLLGLKPRVTKRSCCQPETVSMGGLSLLFLFAIGCPCCGKCLGLRLVSSKVLASCANCCFCCRQQVLRRLLQHRGVVFIICLGLAGFVQKCSGFGIKVVDIIHVVRAVTHVACLSLCTAPSRPSTWCLDSRRHCDSFRTKDFISSLSMLQMKNEQNVKRKN